MLSAALTVLLAFAASEWSLVVIGVGAAVMILAALFLIRRLVVAALSVALLIVGALLLILGLFGGPLGFWDALAETPTDRSELIEVEELDLPFPPPLWHGSEAKGLNEYR